MCLYVPGFQRQVFKHVKKLSEQSKRMQEPKKNKRSVLVAESAYNSQNAQFGLMIKFETGLSYAQINNRKQVKFRFSMINFSYLVAQNLDDSKFIHI